MFFKCFILTQFNGSILYFYFSFSLIGFKYFCIAQNGIQPIFIIKIFICAVVWFATMTEMLQYKRDFILYFQHIITPLWFCLSSMYCFEVHMSKTHEILLIVYYDISKFTQIIYLNEIFLRFSAIFFQNIYPI